MAYTTIDDPSQHHQSVLYTGTAALQAITNTGFGDLAPDFIWMKSRTGGKNPTYCDSSRGTQKGLRTNSNTVEGSGDGTVTAFGDTSTYADGFQIGAANAINDNGESFVAWQWHANLGTTSTNTDGDINSTVQVNSDLGFSIVQYNPANNTARTIGHGLGENPGMIWIRARDRVEDTIVWMRVENNGQGGIQLNSTNSYNPTTTAFVTSSSSTTFGVGTDFSVNGAYNYVAYCFAERQGFSKFGIYHGTGESGVNGTFVYTGFKPAFVLCKYVSTTGSSWAIVDSTRDTTNPANRRLFANLANNETTTIDFVDIHSNGFQLITNSNDYNQENGRYNYWAFAENPFVSSTGIPTTAR